MSIVKFFPKHRPSLQRAALPQLNNRLTEQSFDVQLTNVCKKVFQSSKSAMAPPKDMPSMKINSSRLMISLYESCEFGMAHSYGTHETETGMARVALNEADKAVRRWFIQQAESSGCKITIDQRGNIFGVRPGKNSMAPPVMMGSHLDTQPMEEDTMEYSVCWLVELGRASIERVQVRLKLALDKGLSTSVKPRYCNAHHYRPMTNIARRPISLDAGRSPSARVGV